jgi:predicted nucleic acid-binding protein
MPVSIDTPAGYLLDGNLLIALLGSKHTHSRAASEWITAHNEDNLFLCSITEGTLLRFLMLPQGGHRPSAANAWAVLREFRSRPNVRFLDAGFSYLEVQIKGLTGHKEITDEWLITLAHRQRCHLATLDKGLCDRHPHATALVR